MKVIHGMSEVAGQGIYTVQGLRNNGVHADMAVWSENPIGYSVDINIGVDKNKKYLYPFYIIKMGGFATKAMAKYDILHSHFGYSLLPYNLDLKILKRLKRKVFAEFHGSELRGIFKNQAYEHFVCPTISEKVKSKQKKRLSKLIKLSKGIILHDMELFEQLEEFETSIYILPLRIDVGKFAPNYPCESVNKPVIVHAPSKRSCKGTDRILESLKKVRMEYELILVEGKSQKEAIEIYEKADIIIDQISIGTYGVFAIEAMALGKPVITYISEEMKSSLPKELPIISADFDTLSSTIESLIADGNLRRRVGIESREYVERFHDTNKVTEKLIDIYDDKVVDKNIFKLL